MEDGPIVVLCTAPANSDLAANLARGLVESRLAACVNIVPGIRSIYVWQGKLEDEPEVQLVIKTRASRFADVQRFIEKNHTYEVPEVIAIPVLGSSPAYGSWLLAQTVTS